MAKLKQLMTPSTVGELKAILTDLPDDMPLHHRGNMGDQPRGLAFLIRTLAEARNDTGFFADMEHDTIWSKSEYRQSFGDTFRALCTL